MPNLIDTEEPLALGARLRHETMGVHRSTETRPFIVALMKGELSINEYTRYLGQLAWIYEALESRDPREGDSDLYDQRLFRLAEIEKDLVALGAANWRTCHPPLKSTSRYAAHVAGLAGAADARYLAHHYTRYLGDLSGGQAISRLVARHYDANAEQLNFYRFDGIENLVQFKRSYREGLDALPLTSEEQDAVVAEAMLAFEFNGALFDELHQSLAA